MGIVGEDGDNVKLEYPYKMNFSSWHVDDFDNDSDSDEANEDVTTISMQNNNNKPKQEGLITFSNKNIIPISHWKNLFHLELIKERNKPIQPPVKPKNAPFFLQWRPGQSLQQNNDIAKEGKKEKKNDEEEWEAAWDDDSDDDGEEEVVEKIKDTKKKTTTASSYNEQSKNNKLSMEMDDDQEDETKDNNQTKKSKITHSRSQLISILLQCHENKIINEKNNSNNKDKSNTNTTTTTTTYYYQPVTKFLSTLGGPSAVDIALSSLCYGMHDDPALHYLCITMQWFVESIQLKEDYDVINAYLYRFLYLHGTTIMNEILNVNDDNKNKLDKEQKEKRLMLLSSMKELRKEHHVSSKKLHEKCQYTLCLLRHFLLMV